MEFLQLLSSPLTLQIVTLAILGFGLVLFISDRFRYDVVALFLMILVAAVGIIPYTDVLANFGHPAIIIVASMFVMSAALTKSGIIDRIVGKLTPLYHRPVLALLILTTLVAVISGFVNNIGALAMVIPLALHLAQKGNVPIAFYLLPLAFASHLGGYLTLIGTPRNILISDFRFEATGTAFQMFDFFYVGGAVALAGVVWIVLYTAIFSRRTHEENHTNDLVRTYLTEASIADNSSMIGRSVTDLEKRCKGLISVIKVFRNYNELHDTSELAADDVLVLRGSEEALSYHIDKLKLQLTGIRAREHVTNSDDYASFEVIVPPYATVIGQTWDSISLLDRFGTNFIGLFRRHFNPSRPLAETKIIANDILLLQGRTDSVLHTVNNLGLLPVDNKDLHLGRTTTILGTLSILGVAIVAASLSVAPIAMIFLVAAVALVATGLITLNTMYESIDWPVLVLLAGMITLGDALVMSGATESLATGILTLSEYVTPVFLLGVVLITTMLMSDFVNTTASAVIMAPTAILIAGAMSVSIDPFLMAVAIGASSAFLTPVGHESNAFVMKKGGYHFSDFTKIGLPLELIIACLSLPLILHFWPL